MPVIERTYKVTTQADLEKKVKEFEEKSKERITKEGLEEMKAMNKALNDTVALVMAQGLIEQGNKEVYEKRIHDSYVCYLENQNRDTSVKYMTGAEWDAKIELSKVLEADHKKEQAKQKERAKEQKNKSQQGPEHQR